MVATTDCTEMSKPIAGPKVSKPLMEKKRRARINKCLDQLKSLLESYYSSNIRKRKLEKADILELTVKHLRNLQKIQSCTAASSEFSEYQTGFRSCLANVNQYLVMSDTLNGGDRWMLSQLSTKLCRSLERGEVSSTMDSSPGQVEMRDEVRRFLPSASGSEEGNTVKSKVLKPHSASTSRLLVNEDAQQKPSGPKRAVVASVRTTNSREKSSSDMKCLYVGNQAANTDPSVWRPW